MVSKQLACRLLGLTLLWLHANSGLALHLQHSEDADLDGGYVSWDGVEDTSASLDASNYTDLPQYVLLAPMDSGSNLLEQMIEKNWPRHFRSTSSKPEIIWKHSLGSPQELYEWLAHWNPTHQLKDTHFIAVVRSPISQVASWRNAPYDLIECAGRNPLFFSRPCSATLHMRRDGYNIDWGLPDHPEYPPIDFSSTMDVYNKYVSMYRQVLAEGEFKSAQIIQYEQMVQSPESVVRRISQAFGIREPLRPHAVSAPAKETDRRMHKASNGREAALHKIEQRTYLQTFDSNARIALCSDLDRSLVSGMEEREGIPYTFDCD